MRLYSSENGQPGDDTTFFVAGLLLKRDGCIEKVALADIAGNGTFELVVMVCNAGTAQYLFAAAFGFDQKRLWLYVSAADLPKEADPIAALKKARMKRIIRLANAEEPENVSEDPTVQAY